VTGAAAWADRPHLALYDTMARLTPAGGGRAEERDGALVAVAADPFPFVNAVVRRREGDAGALLDRAADVFASLGRGWTVFVHPGDADLDAAAARRGYQLVRQYPQMTCARRLDEPEPGDGIELREVVDEPGARDYWAVCGAAYRSLGFPESVFAAFGPETLLEDDRAAWTAYVDGEPAATAMIVLADGVGTVSWVAAREEHRGRGLARICTARATNATFERGGDLAVLQASPMGESLYLAMGYEEAYRYRLYRADP
jgi:ribosomal protein S18 acetylase RimI-like enzyme